MTSTPFPPADEPPASAAEEAEAARLEVAIPADLRRVVAALRLYAASVERHSGPAAEETGTWEPADALPDPFPGEYRFRSRLGQGGFGTVWLADDLNLGVPVALKALRAVDPAKLAALRSEARLLAGLRHPNIVQVFAWRPAAGEHYLVLRYVPGGSLADRLARTGPLPWAAAARYVADVGEALVRVHAAGLVHRDVKPANVLWDAEADEAVLTDFGLTARLQDGGPAAGTPAYMPPEAFTGQISPAGDVYGLAATLFALVTGTVPFPTADWTELAALAARGLPDPDPRCAGMPERIERLVRAGLAADPHRRPPPAAFVAGLRGALNQSLADALPPTSAAPAVVRLVIARWDGAGYVPVPAVGPQRSVATRDLRREPGRVELRTGDRVRVQVVADRPGYVTVFNVGPTGNLHVLYPADDRERGTPVAAGHPLDILQVTLTPPAGRERLFAVWTDAPLPAAADLHELAGRDGSPVSPAYRATRDLQLLTQSVARLPPDDRAAVVLELDHQSP